MTRKTAAPQAMTAVAFIFCAFLSTSRVYAQNSGADGLEQTYARLCSNGQQNETCTALRQALLTKLSGAGAEAKVTTSENSAPSAQAALPGQQLAGAAGQPSAATQAANAPYWGHFLDYLNEARFELLREAWHDRDYPSRIITYSWDVPGQVMGVTLTSADGSTKKQTLRWDEQRRALVQSLSDGTEYFLVPQADGSFLNQIQENVRIIHRKFNDGTIEQRTEVKGETGWELAWIYHHVVFSPETIGFYRQSHALNVEMAKDRSQIPRKYFDPEFQRQLQESENARRKQHGGFFRAVIGAGIGLATANAGGMDAAQTIGAAAKGVALMNPESPVAQVIGASGDAVLQSSGLGTAPAGTASGGSGSARASYPTRPNVLGGQAACSMMNESNYRQVGVSGGNDVQLKTMCAQAFEYYTMYKRAIAQGYAEADANRTYSAHEQSARVAISFHAGAR